MRTFVIAVFAGAIAGCTNLPEAGRSEIQDLQVRDGDVVSASLRLHKSIDSRRRWILEAQSLSGKDPRTLALYGEGPVVFGNGGDSLPERFVYENIVISGNPQRTENQTTHNPREMAAEFRLRSLQAAYERTFWEQGGIAFALGGVFKLSDFRLEGHGFSESAAPAEFSVEETDTSVGISTSVEWNPSESVNTRIFQAEFYDPFNDVRGRKIGISAEYRFNNIGVRYTLFRFYHGYHNEPSIVGVMPSGQQFGLTVYY